MSRIALISRNIVVERQNLFRSALPIYGIILIEDEKILDVIHVSKEIPVESLAQKYSDYYPQIYENSYISPGIIDLNSRREWQDFTEFTQQAVKGGVSFILEEGGIFNIPDRSGQLYCDIGQVETIDLTMLSTLKDIAKRGPIAFKGYLYPPSDSVKCLPGNLDVVFKEVQDCDIPLILDVNIPDPRMHYVTSPCHCISLEQRESFQLERNDGIFAAAFPYDIGKNESNASTPSVEETFGEEIDNKLKRTLSNLDQFLPKSSIAIARTQRQSSFILQEEKVDEVLDEGLEPSPKRYRNFLQRRKSYDLFRDLDRRIVQNENTIENLSKAEMSTYSFDTDMQNKRRSRSYEFSSIQIQLQKMAEQPPLPPQKPSRLQSLRPPQIALGVSNPVPKDVVYINYLANCPDKWETQGIEKVIKYFEKSQCRLHIANLSSANSVRLLRKMRQRFKELSCETCSHYLKLHSDMIQDKATHFKDFPPIRNQSNKSLLWECLKLKLIDSISSKHCFIDPLYKFMSEGSFKRALNGVNTQGYTLQALWSHFLAAQLSDKEQNRWIVRISKWLSTHPAKILQIQDRGSIERGKLADLIVWNPFEKATIDSDSIFYGQNFYGKIDYVYIRGEIAYEKDFFEPCGKRIFKTVD